MRAPVSAAPRVIDTATDMVRRLALEKLIPAAGQAARLAGPAAGAASMLAPTATQQMTPVSGPMRGQRINPATGAPWTPQEIEQYETQRLGRR